MDFAGDGGDKVLLNSVAEWDIQTYKTYQQIYKKYPDVIGKDARSLDVSPMHILCNEVIEVADDGKSARAAYMTPGHVFSYLRASGTRWATLMWEHYGSDFVCDDKGHWKYLHEQVCPDFGADYDIFNWGLSNYLMAINPEMMPFEPPAEDEDSEPRDMMVDDPGPVHSEVKFPKPIENLAPWPEPYETMDQNNTYTPFIGKDRL